MNYELDLIRSIFHMGCVAISGHHLERRYVHVHVPRKKEVRCN